MLIGGSGAAWGAGSRWGIGGGMDPGGEVTGGRPLCTSLACATERPCRGDIMYKSYGKSAKLPLIAETCT